MSRKGFTLIELLVVVAVLALLASIVFSNLGGAREGARISNALSFQSQTHSLLGSDLVGWWNFNHGNSPPCGSGKVCDISGYNNHATNNGGVYVDGVPGTGGSAIDINGSSGTYVRTDNNIYLTGSQTFTTWIYSRSTSGLRGVLTTHNHSATSNIGINTNSDQFSISIGYTDGTREYNNKRSNHRIRENEWTHVILVFDQSDNSVSFFINGEFDDKWNLSKEVDFTSERVLIGQWSNTYIGNYIFNGLIDDNRIYSRALTASEIQTLYAQTKDKYLANE